MNGTPLINFSTTLTGRELFAEEQRTVINTSVTQKLASSGHKNAAAVYQTVLKDAWDALDPDDQQSWSTKAKAKSGDIAQYVLPLICSSLVHVSSIETRETLLPRCMQR
jgi:hypothetical protein